MKRLLRPTTDSHHLKVKRVKGSTCLWIKFHANSTYLKKSFHTACKSPAFFHSNQCLAVNNKTIVMFSLTIENCYLVLHNYIVSYLFINNFEPKVLQIFNKNADFSYDVTFLFNTNSSDLILVLTKAQLLLFMIHDWMTNNEKTRCASRSFIT